MMVACLKQAVKQEKLANQLTVMVAIEFVEHRSRVLSPHTFEQIREGHKFEVCGLDSVSDDLYYWLRSDVVKGDFID